MSLTLIELKKALSKKNILLWVVIVLLLPFIRFMFVKDGFIYYKPIEVFHETVSALIPVLFPVIVVAIFLPHFFQEQRHNYMTYVRMRCSINRYLVSKAVINGFLAGAVCFSMMFIPFLIIEYVVPLTHIVHFSKLLPGEDASGYPTFTQFLAYGSFVYGFVYSLWVAINALVYATIGYYLLLILPNPYVALSVPFLFYHGFNFITGNLYLEVFSPISTIFPFNITMQPLWTVTIPFFFLVAAVALLGIYAHRHIEKLVL